MQLNGRFLGTKRELYTEKRNDPVQSLTVTRNDAAGPIASFFGYGGNNVVFSCNVSFPYPATEGCLFEAGASSNGAYAGLRDNGTGGLVFRVRAGDGVALSSSSTQCAILDITDFPKDNAYHQVVWDFAVNPGRVRVWIDGDFKGSSNTSDNSDLELGSWVGGDDGGFTETDATAAIPTGESSADWGGEDSGEGLSFYNNQQVPFQERSKIDSAAWELTNVYDALATPRLYINNHFPTPDDIFWYLDQESVGTNNCNYFRDTNNTSPFSNSALRMEVTGADPYINIYNSAAWSFARAASGETWEISAWARSNISTFCQIFIFGASSGHNGTTLGDFGAYTFSIDQKWRHIKATRTFSDGGVTYIQTRLDGPDAGTASMIWWDGLQIRRIA